MDYIDSGPRGRSRSELRFSAESGWKNCQLLKARLWGCSRHKKFRSRNLDFGMMNSIELVTVNWTDFGVMDLLFFGKGNSLKLGIVDRVILLEVALTLKKFDLSWVDILHPCHTTEMLNLRSLYCDWVEIFLETVC